MNCGEGWPNFYAFDIIKHGMSCVSPMADILMGPLLRQFGGCKSIKDYGYHFDPKTQLPDIEDCVKESFFMYYASP
jgi:hypothetical protein